LIISNDRRRLPLEAFRAETGTRGGILEKKAS
jgi:hypothetical protein